MNPIVAHDGKKLRMEWKHMRVPPINTMDGKVPGGKFKLCTICQLKDEDGIVVLEGSSWCKVADTFTKESGRKRSLMRAIRDMPREERGKFWYAYFARKADVTDAMLEKLMSTKSRRKRRKNMQDDVRS